MVEYPLFMSRSDDATYCIARHADAAIWSKSPAAPQ
jgi:hypothetical protein